MKIEVNRIVSDSDTTLSIVSVDGKFECFGCEDEYRETKLAGETRIPEGSYPVGIRAVGGFHTRYASKFPKFHRGMLEVQNVPNFEYILIHVGNTDADTAGCLLVGTGAFAETNNMSIQASVKAYTKLYQKVIDEAIAGNLTIEYIDNDGVNNG